MASYSLFILPPTMPPRPSLPARLSLALLLACLAFLACLTPAAAQTSYGAPESPPPTASLPLLLPSAAAGDGLGGPVGGGASDSASNASLISGIPDGEYSRYLQAGLTAHVWGQPLVSSVRNAATFRAVNALIRQTNLTTADNQSTIPLQNTDTLYAAAWLDLASGPLLLALPYVAPPRYYSALLVSPYSDVVAVHGARTDGPGPLSLLVQSGGQGSGGRSTVITVRSSTRNVFLIVRVLVQGYEDVPAASNLLSNITLTRPATNAPATPLPPPDLSSLAGLPDGMQRLVLIDRALQDNPPTQDAANLDVLNQLATIGIYSSSTSSASSSNLSSSASSASSSPFSSSASSASSSNLSSSASSASSSPFSSSASPFTPASLSPVQRLALAQAYLLANVTIRGAYTLLLLGVNRSVVVNRWLSDTSLGYYGDRFLFRAGFTSTGGLGALPSAESLYLLTWQDALGQRYDGAANHSLHLSPPPVTACGFWSLTLYNGDGFLPQGLWRNSIGDRTKGLSYNLDGTLTVPIQPSPPPNASLGGNWLPTLANDSFSLVLRVYCPAASVLNRTWAPAAVTLG
ncbi:hypothetical protein CLOM_g1369 [Closterium sp. NIES-68]|nr:hypothetical protein CLOM_g1369 [Closterium sp. NIES-68]